MNLINLKLAYRNLLRNKFYTLLSITGFAIGFAVCLVIGLYIYGETRMNSWMPNADRIVRIYDVKKNYCGINYDAGEIIKNKIPEVEQACAIQFASGEWDIPAKTANRFTKSKGIINTSADFFKIFPLKVIMSNPGGLLSEPKSAVITQSLAKALFPNENPLGQKITIQTWNDVPVSAVVEDFPKNSSIQADIFVSSANMDFRLDQSCNDGKCWNPYTHFVLLKANANKRSFLNNLNTVIPRKDYFLEVLSCQNIKDIYLAPPVDGGTFEVGNRTLLFVLGSFGILILLLSTFNFLNFYISTQYAKIKELGIKKINGASFRELLGYSLAEVSISIIVSLLIAFVVFSLMLPVAGKIFNQPLDTYWLYTPQFAGFLLLLVVSLILLNSFIPIYLTTKFNFGNVLTQAKSVTIKQSGRKVMTFAQFAISIALIIITLSIYRQLNYVKHADLGFNKEHLVRLNFSYSFKNQDALRDKLRQLPDVKDFTLSSGTPGKIHLGMGVGENGKTIMLKGVYADANFFKALGVKINKGRDFSPDDSKTVCIMNEEAYKQYEWKDLDAKRFNQGREGGYEVIGVCNNFFVGAMYEKVPPVVVMLKDETERYNRLRYASILLKPGNVGAQMKQLETVWKSFVPDEPMNYEFYDQTFNAMYQKEERLGKSIAIAAIVALILTFVGILGQAFQISLNRSKEIGIRKVNGATVGQVLANLNKGFIPLVAVAFVVASPVAYYFVNKWLEAFAYKSAIGWWLFALAGIIVLLTVFATVTLQSWKTATRNPVEALRYE